MSDTLYPTSPRALYLAGAVSVVKMVEETSEIMAARERMIARRFGGANATRTGGVRRKKKNVHKTATSGGSGWSFLPQLFVHRALSSGTHRSVFVNCEFCSRCSRLHHAPRLCALRLFRKRSCSYSLNLSAENCAYLSSCCRCRPHNLVLLIVGSRRGYRTPSVHHKRRLPFGLLSLLLR